MTIRIVSVVIAGLLGMIAVDNVRAAKPQPVGDVEYVTIYRGANGQLTQESKRFANKLIKKASTVGHVTLWLTIDLDYYPHLDQLTDEQIAAQEKWVSDSFAELLKPLVQARSVWHPRAGPHVRGPGCMVRANADGILALLGDTRLLQIVEIG